MRATVAADRAAAAAKAEVAAVRKELTITINKLEREARAAMGMSKEASGRALSGVEARYEAKLGALRSELASVKEASKRAVAEAESLGRTEKEKALIEARKASDKALKEAKAKGRAKVAQAQREAAAALADAKSRADEVQATQRAKYQARMEEHKREMTALADKVRHRAADKAAVATTLAV